MAAATAPPRSPTRRKPVPLRHLSPVDRLDWGENAKPLGRLPSAESPRLRQPPGSPVKVKFQPEDWAKPSNADIESTDPNDRPSMPERPIPPPHTPETSRRASSRHSRESLTTASLSQKQASTESSTTTRASSVSGINNEACDGQPVSGDVSPESSVMEDGMNQAEPVPQFHYHHHSAFLPRPPSIPAAPDLKIPQFHPPDLADSGAQINRHLTPTSNYNRLGSLPRPSSTYSVYSDFGPGARSSVYAFQTRAASAQSRRSPETRLSSFAELLNVPYPQPSPAPITLDNSQLRTAVGNNASLLSTQKTLEMYRQNVKKTGDFSIQYSFAVFLIATAQEQGLNFAHVKRTKSPKPGNVVEDQFVDGSPSAPQELVREARAILQKLSNNGYPFAQYYLADGYASGLFSKGKEDYYSAFPLFVLAAKHGHAEAAYRTALCYEFGWGCRKDPAKAVQFLRTAASKRHPGAMTRLGKACLSGDLGEKRYREGIKWLKLATESADAMYNAAPYHLGCLYETGYGDDIFQDEGYAAELFTQAAELGHAEASFRMGDAYEHGRFHCPRDPALSLHFYTGAAERGHAEGMMGLCAWYMVGAEPVLDKDEEEAYEWARRSAELGASGPCFLFLPCLRARLTDFPLGQATSRLNTPSATSPKWASAAVATSSRPTSGTSKRRRRAKSAPRSA